MKASLVKPCGHCDGTGKYVSPMVLRLVELLDYDWTHTLAFASCLGIHKSYAGKMLRRLRSLGYVERRWADLETGYEWRFTKRGEKTLKRLGVA